ncbi:MAG: nucleoside-diphosphate sugar epimerase/dehydratase [Sulfuricellaceae bacterium]|nr:nucleoside-diphosphate sugar epimerase/dehydratase [Sulfuricellaceae bacterium]
MKINSRTTLVMLHDLVAAAVAWWGAYLLRFNLAPPAEFSEAALATLLWVVPVQAALFWVFGLYRGLWRFASLPDLKCILQAVGAAAVAIPVILILFRVQATVPRSVLILDPLLLVVFLGGSRIAYRAWKDRRFGALLDTARPALVLGAGAAADALLREFTRTQSELRIIGLLDDSMAKQGRRIQGLPVLGGLDQLAEAAARAGVKDAILAIPSAPQALRKRLVDECAALGINLLTVPSLNDIVQGRVSVASLRNIELDDLLGRPPVQLDNAGLHAFLAGKTVLVTGAGGSIGAELCRQIAQFKPARLLLFELGEYALYQIEQDFRRAFPEVPVTCLIGDAKDPLRVGQIMRKHLPAVVFHTAAYKHVPLMEENNALQALKNNVLGTWVVAKAARAAGVEKFVMVSTDKAVNPTNIMGASKRLAEMLCQALHVHTLPGPRKTAFLSVRFGNVLGSSGSVIPKFQQQIEAGGPVTVTHPDITRYFMSIPEAAQLVLQAGLMGQGGEIYVLDMGEPVKIVDLARLMIRLSGKVEDEIGVEYTGLRPGEKLYEELLADSEASLPTPHPKLRVARARETDADNVALMLDWVSRTDMADAAEVRAMLREWLPEYRVGQLGAT